MDWRSGDFDIKYDWPTIGCFTLLSVGCVLAGYGVQPWDLWTRLAVYLAISLAYPVLALLLLVRSPSERRTYTCCSENCGPCVD